MSADPRALNQMIREALDVKRAGHPAELFALACRFIALHLGATYHVGYDTAAREAWRAAFLRVSSTLTERAETIPVPLTERVPDSYLAATAETLMADPLFAPCHVWADAYGRWHVRVPAVDTIDVQRERALSVITREIAARSSLGATIVVNLAEPSDVDSEGSREWQETAD